MTLTAFALAVAAAMLHASWNLVVLAVAGAASVTSYALVLIAATRAPVGTVAAVRETSVVFAVLGGRLFSRAAEGGPDRVVEQPVFAGC